MKRITGTSVYTYPKCPRAVALDFHGDREQRRPPTEVEEFVLRRGRDLEDRLTADMGWPTPSFAERDFEAGATATLELLREGVPGVLQGVLLEEERLGIPDLLRREDGDSDLGAHHYVVGDIKSSAAARGDQVLQVMFYSRLLERRQGRAPSYAYLVLRDGHEERFDCADYAAVIDEVDSEVAALRSGDVVARPFLSSACSGCRWSEVCLPELEEKSDLSLLHGMTRGLRETLEAVGVADAQAAASMSVESVARHSRLEAALLRRLKKAAQARAVRHPLPERRTVPAADSMAVIHLLGDVFAERVYYFGILLPERDEVVEVFPASHDDELSAFTELIEQVPKGARLWHYGWALPRWYDRAAWRRERSIRLEARFVDLARRLRGAAVYPGPVFGLHSHVQYGLGLDPHRAGDANAIGLWAERPQLEARLRGKGRSDLADLAALITRWVEGDGVGSES